MPDKPPMGSPCNRCGWCCRVEVCILGRTVFGECQPAPCPALRVAADATASCGLVEDPAAYICHRGGPRGAKLLGQAAAAVIAVGLGCDAQAESEPFNVAYDRRLSRHFHRNRTALMCAAHVWGV